MPSPSSIAFCWQFFTRDPRRSAQRWLLWFTVLLGFATSSANAQYVNRYNTITGGAITFTGNTLGLSKATNANAPGTNGSIGTFITTDTSLQDGTAPTAYPLGTTADWTKNGSEATLVIPAGATIKYAELIWGGSYAHPTGATATAENVKASIDVPIKLTLPNGTSTTVTRDTATAKTLGVDSATTKLCTTGPCFYVRSQNVTSTIQAAGAGKYVVGGVPATQANTEDNSNTAGWTLAVVYEKSGLPSRNLTVFVGAEVGGGAAAQVSGFCTPASSTRTGRLLVSAMEGDAGLGGDQMKFGPTAASLTALSGPNNPVGNFFAGQINIGNETVPANTGKIDTTGSFGTVNHNAAGTSTVSGGRQGWDITNVDVSSTLGSGQTTAFAQGTTSADQYVISALALQIDVGAPKFPTTVKTVDKTEARVGDVLTYTVKLDNSTGTADATNVVFKDPVPAGTGFVAGSMTIDGVAQASADPTSAAGVAMGTIAAGTLKTVTFKVTVNSVPAAPALAQYLNEAKWTYSYVSCAGQPTQTGSLDTDNATTKAPRLEPSKSVSPVGALKPGDTLTYTITVPNTGLASTLGTTFKETIPAGTTYVAGSTTLNTTAVADVTGAMPYLSTTQINNAGSSAGSIAAGASATVIFKVKVNPSTLGTITNTANVDQDGGGPIPLVNVTASNTVTPTADLSITKIDTPDPVIKGNTLIYKLTVQSAGPSSITGATVTDTLPAGLSGATWTCVASGSSSCPASGSGNIGATINIDSGAANKVVFTVTGTVTSSANLSNTASVDVPSGSIDSDTSNNTATEPTVVIEPDVTVTKSHAGNFVRGGSGSYSLEVKNVGTSPTSASVTVSDILPAGLIPGTASGNGWICSTTGQTVSCSRSDALAVNASYPIVSIPVTVSQTAAASITNTANVSGGGESNTTNNASNDPTTFTSSSDLEIIKTGPTSATPGANLVYTIQIKNNGPSDSQNVSVSDPTPSGLTFVSNTGNCTTAFPCSLGTIANGATKTITVTYSVPATYTSNNLGPDPISNTASATSSTPDPTANSSTATTPVSPSADLSLSKTVSENAPNIGSNVSFTLTLKNAGPSNTSNVVVNDQLPAGLQYVSSSASLGTYNDTNGNWTISSLGLGTQTLTITAKVTGTGSTGTAAIINTAQVTASSASDPDSTPNDGSGDDAASASLRARMPDLTVSKDHPSNFIRGTNNSYSITVSNAGDGTTIAAVTITDTLPAGLTPGTASGNGWTCTTSGQDVSCSRSDALAPGASYPTITVPVAIAQSAAGGSGASSLTNTANVTGGGEVVTTNNSGSDLTPIVSSADMKVGKTGPAKAIPGTNLSYTLTITNDGPSNAVNVVLNDATPTGLTFVSNTGNCTTAFPCNYGLLAPGETKTVTVTYSVPNNYISSNLGPDPIQNTATVGSDTPDPAAGSNTATVGTSLNAPIADLGLTKTDFPASSTAIPGTQVTYKIVITNAGPSAAAGARVIDNFPATITGIAWTCAATGTSSCSNATGTGNINELITIIPGDTITFSATGTVMASATGNLVNTATVTPPLGTSDPSSANNNDSNTLTPKADLEIKKTGPAQIVPGSNAVYTITVKNLGPSNAASVSVDDPTPASLNFVSNSGDCATAFPCDLGVMAPNTSKTFTVTYGVPANYATPNPVVNTANVSSLTPDPIGTNDSSSANTPVTAQADLSLTKTVSNASPVVGSNIKYTITLTNAGPSSAQNVEISDQLPTGLQFVSSNPSNGTYSSGSGIWTVGNVPSGIQTLEITAKVLATGSISNSAEVTKSDTPDPDSSPNDGAGDDTASVTLSARAPDLSITKTHTGNFTRGSSGTYSITVTNNGDAPTNAPVTISDPLPVGLNPTGASGNGWVCSITGQALECSRGDALGIGSSYPVISVNVDVAQTISDSVTNTATVSGGGEIATGNNTASDPTSVTSSADLSLAKTVDDASPTVGQNITYTITLTNAGPSTANNVTVGDNLPVGLEFVSAVTSIGSYDPIGGNWNAGSVTVGTHTLSITAKVKDAASLTNTAEVSTSSTPDPDSTPNDGAGDDRAAVSLISRVPDLTVVKSHTGNFTRGSSAAYTIAVTNSGTAPTQGTVTISDTLPAGLTPSTATGTNWTCTVAGQTVTCSRNDALGAGSSYPDITININVKQNAAANLINTASVSGGGELNIANSSDNDPTTIISSADLQVLKTGPTSITPGSSVTYEIKITNTGPSDALNVNVSDATPAGLNFVSSSGDCSASFPCNLGTIASGEARTIQVTYDVPANYAGASPIKNTASATSSTPDPTPGNNSSEASGAVASSADVVITKTGPSSIVPGTNATYTITVQNNGPSDAVAVNVNDLTPAGLSFLGNTGDCVTTFPCNLGTVPVGVNKTITVTYGVPANYTTPNPISDPVTNTASATSSTPDPTPNSSTATAPLAPSADLSVQKSVSDNTPNIGDVISFTIQLTNTGPSVAQNVTLNDPLPAGLSYVSSNPSVGTYDSVTGNWTISSAPVGTQTLTISAKITNANAIINTAQVTASSTPDPDSTPNDGIGDDRASVGLNATAPDLQVKKSHTGNFVRGTNNTYTIQVTNTGDGATIAGVTVTDKLPTGLTPGAATGNGWTCTTTGQDVSCSRSDVLAAGSAYPSISIPVTVEQSAAGGTGASSLTNTANVAGGGELVTTNNSDSDPTNIVSSADVKITKTGPVKGLAGTNVSYNITISNDGPSNAVNLIVSDPTPAGLTFVSSSGDCTTAFPCNFALLAPGASKTITVTYSIPSAYTTPDPIQNTVSVGSDTPDPAADSNTATAATSLNAPVADLSLTKTDFPASSTAIPGTSITYKIVVSNAGPSDAIGAKVVDNFPTTITGVNWTCTASAGSSCPASGAGNINATVNLANAGTITFTATGTVIASATGNLVNTATVTPPVGTSDPTSANNGDSNTLTPVADLEITKTGPASIIAGTNVTYTIQVTNKGPSNAASVGVDDPTPAGLNFVSSTGDCTTAFPCDFGTLAPNTTKTITVTYGVPSDFVGSSLANTATVTSPTNDPTPDNNSKTTTATVGAQADLSVQKTSSTAAPVVGENVTFTITLTNAGPSDALNVEVKDQLPSGLQFVSSNPSSGTYNLTTGIWTISRVVTGTQTLEITAKVLATGSITNVSEVTTSDTPDPDSSPNDGTGDDRSSVTLGAIAPDLSIIKTHTGNFVRGQTGTYSLQAKNDGSSVTSAPVTVSDTLPLGLTPVTASGSDWTCGIIGQVVNCTYDNPINAGSSAPVITITVAVEQSAALNSVGSSLTNTANVSGGGEINTGNNSANDPTTITSSADLSVLKTSNNASPAVGDLVTFTIQLTNSGPSVANNVKISDALPASLEFVSSNASLGGYDAIGGEWNLGSVSVGTHTLSVTAKVLQPGAISNSAEVSASGTPDPDSATNDGTGDDFSSVTLSGRVPDLSITKTHTGNFTRGSSGTYVITVKNIGDASTQGTVNVVDVLPAGLIPSAASGTGWNCSIAGQAVSCSRSDALTTGSSYATITVVVAVDESSSDSVTNTASLNGGGEQNTANSSTNDPTTVVSSADLRVIKTAPVKIVPGLSATFSVQISNDGPSTANDVTLNDPTPAGLSFVSSTGDCTGAMPCNLGNIPSGQTRTVQITYSVPAGYMTPNPVSNTASVTTPTPDPDATNNSSTVTAPVNASSDLQIGKVGPASIVPGLSATFTITVKNNGPSDSSNVNVNDVTPAGLSFVGNTGDCVTAFPCSLGTIPNGATRTIQATYNVPANYAAANPLINTASVTSSTTDPSVPNTASSSTPVAASADLSVSKTVLDATPNIGSNAIFTITLTNNGPSSVSSATVKDQLPAGLTFVSSNPSLGAYDATSGNWTISNLGIGTQTLEIIATVNGAGPNKSDAITNTAQVTASSANDPDSTPNDNIGDDFDSVGLTPQVPDLTVSKTHAGDFTRGTANTYTVRVTNTGTGSTIAPVSISDTLPTGLTPGGATGFGWTCTTSGQTVNCSRIDALAGGASYPLISIPVTVEQNAALTSIGSSLTNTVSVSGGGDPTTTNNSDGDPTTINSSSDLEVLKTGPAKVVVGNTVTYSITVTNNGPSDATNVTLSDPTPTGLSFVSNTGACTNAFPCNLGTVAAGSSKTISATYTVPGDYITGNLGPDPFTNTAQVSSDTPDADPSNNTGTSSTAVNAPVADLSITKVDFPASSTTIPGSNITYKITLTNAGPNVATGARVVDTFPAAISGVTWTCAASGTSSCGNANGTGNINELVTLKVGETITFTATGTIAASATGDLINAASITPPPGTSDPSGNNDSDTNRLTPQADLEILKTGPANAVPGTNVIYTITVTNKGLSNATDVQVDDPTPAGLSFVSSTGPCTTAFPCDLGTMAPNTSKTITVTYSVPSDLTGSSIANIATVSSTTPDPIPGNNSKTAITPVGSSADLSVVKTVDKTAPVVGENLKFTITLTNAGPSDAQNIEVKDALPTGLTFVSSNPSVGSYNATSGLWTVSSLAPGSASLTVIAKVTAATSITNTAEVTKSDTPDPDSTPNDGKGDDFSSVTLGSTQPDLRITKTHIGNLTRGGNGTYLLTVTNSGSSATNAAITVTDILPIGLTPTSATGTNWTCSVVGQTVTCSRNDVLAAGSSLPVITLNVQIEQGANDSITNTANVSGGGEGNTANSSSNDPTTIVSSADLSTKKTADKTAANIGDVVKFTITLTNAGPSSATNVVISDPLPAGLEFISSSASVGAYNASTGAWTIGNATVGTQTLTINAKVLTGGSITNTAKITSSDTPDPDKTNDGSSVTIGATAPDLSITKTHAGNFTRGQTGVYSITVKNIGAGASVAQVSMIDTLPTGLIPTAASGSGWNCSINAQTVACSRSDILTTNSSYAPILITVDVAQTAALNSVGSSLTNTANVSGGGQSNTTNDSSSDPTTITSSSDLKITKTGPTSITPGLPATYTIRVTNLGPSDARTVTVNDATPTGLIFVSSTGDCATAFPCTLGDIPTGATHEITVTYDVPNDYVTAVLGADPILNTANVTSSTPDPDTVNSSSTATAPIAGSADLQITKVGPSTKVTPGTNISYTLKIKNAGPSDALNVTLDDPTPTGLNYVSTSGDCNTLVCDLGRLKPGETRTVIVTFAVPSNYLSDKLGPDPIENTASVKSDTPDPNAINSSATATTSLGSSIADLSISKDDGTPVAIPGAPITYTISVKNAGPSAANGARVIDTLPSAITGATWTCSASAGSSCSAATGAGDLNTLINIDVNGTVTFTLKGTVAATATGLLVNSASVIPPANVTDPSSANNTDQDSLVPQANLTIQKTGPASITPGSRATYTITVTNAGPSNAANVNVSDPTPSGLNFVSSSGDCLTAFPCGLGTVAPNTTRTITVTYDVPANFAGSSVTNSASATSSTPDPSGPNTSSVTTPLAGSADLSLSKTVTNSAPLPGSSVTFTIRLNNAGPSDAVNVNVSELLPTGLSLQSSTFSTGAYNASTGEWKIARVPANSSATLTLTVIVTSGGPIKNTAEIVSSGTPDPDSTPGNSAIGEDDISSITFGAPVSDLSITKTNGTTSSVAGSLVTYTITVSNNGPDSATGASVNDIMPANLSGVNWTCTSSAGSSCPANGTGNIATTVNLLSAGTATFTVSGTLNATATGALTNTTTVTPPSGTNDPEIGNNASTDTDAIGTQADLEIKKTGPGTVNKNNLVKYDITVKNNGPSSAANVIITDPLPAGLEYVSSNPSQGACGFAAGTVTCNLGTLANTASATVEVFTKAVGIGKIDNTATVSSDATDLVSTNNSSVASITVGTLSDLTITKTHEGTFVVDDFGTYTLRVSNIGTDADPGPITLTDTLPVGLSFVGSSGDGWTCTANAQTVTCKHSEPLASNASLPDLSIRVKVLPEAFPNVTNTAQVSSTFGESNTTNNSASDATGVTAPVLKLSKTASSGLIEIGGTLGYTLTMKNTGIIVIDTLELSDNLPLGLVYKTASSTLDGVKIADPKITLENGKQILTWIIPGSLEPNAERSIKFTVIATPQLPETEVKNTASASGKAGPLSVVVASNVAVAQTKTSKGIFNNKGVIVGRVYFDKNDNLSFEEGIDEPLEGARVYLTDGRYAITDSKGRYSLPEIDGGRYAVRLDPLTVPYEPKAVPDDQGLRGTRLVELENGGISTEDFPLQWAQAAIVKARSTQVQRGPVGIVKRLEQGGAGYAVSITIKLETAVKNLTITDPLPNGATRGPIEMKSVQLSVQLIASDGRILEVKLDGDKLVIEGILEPGEYTLRYAIFTALPPESVVTDPSISYAEVIR